MNKVRVIGLGSPWGDDQAGWRAAAALREMFDENAVDVRVLDRPGAALPQHWQNSDWVVLLDAVRGVGEVGRIHALEGAAIRRYATSGLSSHNIGVAEAVALADAVGALPRRLYLLGLEIGAPQPSAKLSPEVECALAPFTEAARAKVAEWLSIRTER
ncbi:MAG: hydrogenase maturation protease [Pseudomonadota bacterium]